LNLKTEREREREREKINGVVNVSSFGKEALE
jgi:hypothetical protein